jgi:hypothetical protein
MFKENLLRYKADEQIVVYKYNKRQECDQALLAGAPPRAECGPARPRGSSGGRGCRPWGRRPGGACDRGLLAPTRPLASPYYVESRIYKLRSPEPLHMRSC